MPSEHLNLSVLKLCSYKYYMNYNKIYNQIIRRARSENRSKKHTTYYENHHILPRSLGGTNEKENLVLLTGKEHYIVHLLLTKIVNKRDSYKMHQALILMGRFLSIHKRSTSRLYTQSRKMIAKAVSKRHQGTLIVKDLVTNIRIGRVSKTHPKVVSGEWVFFHVGMTRSKEYKMKISQVTTGLKNGNAIQVTNEKLIQYSHELIKLTGEFTFLWLKRYVQHRYGLSIPKTINGIYRKSFKDFCKKHSVTHTKACSAHFKNNMNKKIGIK